MAKNQKFSWKSKTTIASVLAVIGGVLYRMGGSGNFPRQARMVGVSIVSCGMLMLFDFRWWIILCIPLMIGALSTYWKKKGTDAMWYHWMFHALGLSIAMLPYAIVSGHYIGFAIRTVVLTTAITVESELVGNAVVEEFLRGFFTVITIPLLLI